MSLLAADEPDPAIVLNEGGRSDFFLLADHAGRQVPRALGDLGVNETERARHIAWDIGIAGVTERLAAALDAPAVMQRYSRLVIDCNRQPGLPSSMPVVGEATRIPGNEGLTDADRSARRVAIFDPYHARITSMLDSRQSAGRRTVLISMHSFTPVFHGVARPMHVAVLYNRDTRLAHPLLEMLRAEGDIVVGDNDPYHVTDASDYAIPVHGERRGLVHAEIEIRQDLIAEPGGQAMWAARFGRLLPAADALMLERMAAAGSCDEACRPS
jgi:predicted N-formylglutamate amidohydrolase